MDLPCFIMVNVAMDRLPQELLFRLSGELGAETLRAPPCLVAGLAS